MNSKSFACVLSLVFALSLSACGGTDSVSEAEPADAVPVSDVMTADAEDAPEIVEQFVFTNTGSVEICELYLSPVEEEEWGPDQLEENTIPAGESFTLKNIPAGAYDAKAVGCNEDEELVVQLDIVNQ